MRISNLMPRKYIPPARVKVPGAKHTERREHRLLNLDEFKILVEITCAHYGVPVDYIHKPGNMSQPPHQKAREVVAYLCWNSYDVSQAYIAKLLNLTTTTTRRYIDIVEDERAVNKRLDAFLTQVENDIIARRIANVSGKA